MCASHAAGPSHSGYRKLQVVVDSGAAESVIPTQLLDDYPVTEGEAAKAGVKYTAADGGEVFNLGEQYVPFRTQEGHSAKVCFQVTDVRRPLLSVAALTAKGNTVNFGNFGGSIRSSNGKKVMNFRKQQGVYVLDMWIPPFQRQG